jgi:hypothetical protein
VRTVHSRRVAAGVLAALGVLLAGCADTGDPAPSTSSPDAATSSILRGEGLLGDAVLGDGATPAAPAPEPSAEPAAPDPDALAGLLSRDVPDSGDGTQVVVPGEVAAPPGERPVTVAVAVEGGVPVDGAAVADFVMTTLNDPRGWVNEGYVFGRTGDADDADVTVVLGSPAMTERLCRPLRTYGKVSCRNGGVVALTHFRWVGGTADYADDLTAYRHYLVNHEVGHYLGKGHVGCPGTGAVAPVMLQQTLGLQGCARNPWPYP